jgi:pimeloyl-ACP methyl ester carboxylesterase
VGDGDAMVRTDKFRYIFAQDMPRNLVTLMAHSQRPAALSALVIPAGEPGWRTIPSYYLVANDDHLIPPAAQIEMARRADATWRGIDSSHVVMMRRPEATVRYILRADAEN